MQVTSLFAIFFAFLTFAAPLATLAMQISLPSNITSGLNATITCTDVGDATGPLTFFLVRNNETQATIAKNASAVSGTLTVAIPANATGDGWTIQASDGKQVVGSSSPFAILAPVQTGKKSMAVPIVGAVVATVIVVALLVLALFFYIRRRRQLFASPVFNLEASFPSRTQGHQISRSFSSTSAGTTDTNIKPSKSLEMEKVEWETQLEEQFARARAATPDIRGAMATPSSLVPQRGPMRNPSY